MIALGPAPLQPGELLARFCAACGDGAGAVVSFTGLCRAEPDVLALELEAYPGFSDAQIALHADAARARFACGALWIAHRTGRIVPGETIVFVAAAARHRRAAFEACDHVMDYLKSRAPLWKKEIGARGERWIEPRAQDYQDAGRWDAAPLAENRS